MLSLPHRNRSEFSQAQKALAWCFRSGRAGIRTCWQRITDEQLRAIWQRAMQDRFNPPTCPIKDSDLLYGPLIPCEGIDILLRQNPVISRGLFRLRTAKRRLPTLAASV